MATSTSTMTTAPAASQDALALKSGEEAFQHPLPVVRRMEQQLRVTLDENQRRLRALVGTSYRELLGTAERIIAMDEQVQRAEVELGELGRRCSARALEKTKENHERMRREREEGREKGTRLAVLAQTKVLQSALAVASRTVRGAAGDALLAGKLLVLARLLHKSLADGGDAPAVLGELRRKLAQTRKRLLTHISRVLVRREASEAGTRAVAVGAAVRTLCAYALVTSSAPRDVLRYFLEVRAEQLQAKREAPSETNLAELLDLYGQTLSDVRDVFPRRFAEELSQLSTQALVRDPDVAAVFELSLDIYGQWIADDVRNFHPWVRHEQVSARDVGDVLAAWTERARVCLLQALSEVLRARDNAHAVLALRQKMLSRYLTLTSRRAGEGHVQTFHNMRSAFSSRLEELAAQAVAMPDFTRDLPRSAEMSRAPRMWDLGPDELELHEDAREFRNMIVRRHHGRVSAVEIVASALDEWVEKQDQFVSVISSMRTTKWDEDLDLDYDDLSDEDSLQAVLTKQDPLQLEARLRTETTVALRKAYESVEGLSQAASVDPALVIRVVREIDKKRRSLHERVEAATGPVGAKDDFLASVHRQAAEYVSEAPVRDLSASVSKASRTPVGVWDGSPPLPVQATPYAFRFLKQLHAALSDAGDDLWSPRAIRALKATTAEKLNGALQLDSLPIRSSAEEQQASESSPSPWTRERLLQHLFDLLYLQCALHIRHGTDGEPDVEAGVGSKGQRLDELVAEVESRVEHDAPAFERIRKNAAESWKRTFLLFGLLAQSG